MGIFEVVEEHRTILPVKAPDIDIHGALSELQFDAHAPLQEVAVAYIAGILDLYKDAGGKEDIIGQIVERHFDRAQTEKARKLLKPTLAMGKPKMVPWALYEIVAEEVRLDLAKQRGLEDKVDPTVFPFLVGVYSIVAHPAVVFSSSFLPIEGLIENVNRFGKRLNTVTTMETREQGVYDPEINLMRATLRRQQDKAAVQALEIMVRQQNRENSEEIVRAICARDLATVCGALVGGSLLKGQRLRAIEVHGDPQGTTDISIYYPRAYRSALQLPRVFDALGLAATTGRSRGGTWREQYIAENLDAATAPLNALASKILSKRIEKLTRAEEAEIRIKRLRELAQEASHHVKNPASALLGLLRLLTPDEEEIFRGIQDEKRETHILLIKEVAAAREYSIEGTRGHETQKKLHARYDRYRARAEQEGITPVARRVLDPLCGTYIRARANVSVAILDDLFTKIKDARILDAKEIESLEKHYKRIQDGLESAERIAENIIERTRGLSALAKEDFTRDEKTKKAFCLYDAIIEGTELLQMQAEKPTIVIDVSRSTQIISHRETIASTIENITWNAYEAIQGKAGVDPSYKGEAVILWYDQEIRTLYIANTGPAIPDHRIPEIFSLRTKTAIAKLPLKQATGTGTSMALKRDMLAALEHNLICYTHKEREGIQRKYPVLGGHDLNVVFGIEFTS